MDVKSTVKNVLVKFASDVLDQKDIPEKSIKNVVFTDAVSVDVSKLKNLESVTVKDGSFVVKSSTVFKALIASLFVALF